MPWVWEFYQTGPTAQISKTLEPGTTDAVIALITALNVSYRYYAPPIPAVDTVAPVVVLTLPFTGSTIGALTQQMYAVASDIIGVTRVELYVDAGLVATIVTPPYTFTANTSGLGAGAHTMSAKAFDAAGNNATYLVNVTK